MNLYLCLNVCMVCFIRFGGEVIPWYYIEFALALLGNC